MIECVKLPRYGMGLMPYHMYIKDFVEDGSISQALEKALNITEELVE